MEGTQSIENRLLNLVETERTILDRIEAIVYRPSKLEGKTNILEQVAKLKQREAHLAVQLEKVRDDLELIRRNWPDDLGPYLLDE